MSPGAQSNVTRMADEICSLIGAQRSAVVLGRDGNSSVYFIAAAGEDVDSLLGARGPAEGSGLVGNVLEGGDSILAETAQGDGRVHQGHVDELGIVTALGVPVLHAGQPFAVLMALNRQDGGRFSAADERDLARYASEIEDELWAVAAAESAAVDGGGSGAR